MTSRGPRRSTRALVPALLALAGAAVPVRAQRTVQERLDSMAARAPADMPGCAVAATGPFGRVETAWGLADLERGVANTPRTIFEAGSVSKQFTAAAVVLLAQRGKLGLDDDIRKYIPEVPRLGRRPITIRQLLNQTSGLREWGVIAGVQGWPRGTRAYTNAHVLDIVAHQRALNFTPGDEWMYSNTNYNLAAILVERVSGKPLVDFMDAEFFVPLGMMHTSWRDDYRRIVPGRALAYERGDDGLHTAMPNEDAYGNDGLLTTVSDLLRWNAAELDSGQVGGAALPAALEAEGRLNNGKPDGYGLGLFLGAYRGVREISHTGATGGYRAYLARWPERHVSAAVLCNGGGRGPEVEGLKAALLGDVAAPATRAADSAGRPPTPVALTPTELAAFTGLYRDRGTMQPIPLVLEQGKLSIVTGLALEPVSATEFRPGVGVPFRLVFRPGSAQERPTALLIAGQDTTELEPVAPFDPTKIPDYVGRWYSPEAQATWTIGLEAGELVARNGPGPRLPLTPAYADALAGPGGSVLVFYRNETGRASELGVWMPRARDMVFERR